MARQRALKALWSFGACGFDSHSLLFTSLESKQTKRGSVMGIERDPVYAIILCGFDDDREAGWEMVKALSELDSIGDGSHLEANGFYA